MKLILLSDGLQDKYTRKLLREVLQTEQDQNLCEKTILVVHEKRINRLRSFTNKIVNSLVDLGFDEANITIWDFNPISQIDEPEELIRQIKEKYRHWDYVYVGEGHAFKLLLEMRADGIMASIRFSVLNGNTVYVGASAGSMLCGKDVILAKYFGEDNVGIDFPGFNFLKNSAVVPHLTKKEFSRFLENLSEKDKYTNIYSVPPRKALVVNDETIRLLGL